MTPQRQPLGRRSVQDWHRSPRSSDRRVPPAQRFRAVGPAFIAVSSDEGWWAFRSSAVQKVGRSRQSPTLARAKTRLPCCDGTRRAARCRRPRWRSHGDAMPLPGAFGAEVASQRLRPVRFPARFRKRNQRGGGEGRPLPRSAAQNAPNSPKVAPRLANWGSVGRPTDRPVEPFACLDPDRRRHHGLLASACLPSSSDFPTVGTNRGSPPGLDSIASGPPRAHVATGADRPP